MRTKRNQPDKNLKNTAKKRRQRKGSSVSAPLPEAPVSLPHDGGEIEKEMAVEIPSSAEVSPPPSSLGVPTEVSPPEPSNRQESIQSTTEEETSLAEGDELELLTFFLAKEEYAIDIMMIQEITKLTEMTPIPRTSSYIHGIVTLRGNVIPVFNLHERLKLDPFVARAKSRFVICQLKEGAAAITVDEVIDVIHLKKNRLEPPPSGVAAHGRGFIKNIGRSKERLLILLDVEKALHIEQFFSM